MEAQLEILDISQPSKFAALSKDLASDSVSLAFAADSGQGDFSGQNAGSSLQAFIGQALVLDLSSNINEQEIKINELQMKLSDSRTLAEKLSRIYGVDIQIPSRVLLRNAAPKKDNCRYLSVEALEFLLEKFCLIGCESRLLLKTESESEQLRRAEAKAVSFLLNLNLQAADEGFHYDLYAAPVLVKDRLKPVRAILLPR